jgi:hypothetical protein
MALMLAGKPAEAIERYRRGHAGGPPTSTCMARPEARAAPTRSRREMGIYEQLTQNRLQRAGTPR